MTKNDNKNEGEVVETQSTTKSKSRRLADERGSPNSIPVDTPQSTSVNDPNAEGGGIDDTATGSDSEDSGQSGSPEVSGTADTGPIESAGDNNPITDPIANEGDIADTGSNDPSASEGEGDGIDASSSGDGSDASSGDGSDASSGDGGGDGGGMAEKKELTDPENIAKENAQTRFREGSKAERNQMHSQSASDAGYSDSNVNFRPDEKGLIYGTVVETYQTDPIKDTINAQAQARTGHMVGIRPTRDASIKKIPAQTINVVNADPLKVVDTKTASPTAPAIPAPEPDNVGTVNPAAPPANNASIDPATGKKRTNINPSAPPAQ